MLRPSLQIHDVNGVLLAEFWDCLRMPPEPTLELRTKFDEHVKAKKRPFVVVDLEGVGFAGSASLGNFVALQRTTRQNGGRVVFCCVEPTVFEVFRASNIDRLFEFTNDRESALAAVERGEVEVVGADASQDESTPKAPRTSTQSSGPLKRLRRMRDASEPQ